MNDIKSFLEEGLEERRTKMLILKSEIERRIDLNYFTVECAPYFVAVNISSKDFPQTDEERKKKWKMFPNFIECEVCICISDEDEMFFQRERDKKDEVGYKTIIKRDLSTEYLAETIMKYKRSEVSPEISDLLYKFMKDYEDIKGIEKPLSTNSDINALYWSSNITELLSITLDVLYKPLKG